MDTTVEISSNNLYVTGYVVEFPEDGEAVLLRDRINLEGDVADQYHTYRGEKLRQLAYDYYKNYDSKAASLWWVIADANNIANPFDMEHLIGTRLVIPSYEKAKLAI